MEQRAPSDHGDGGGTGQPDPMYTQWILEAIIQLKKQRLGPSEERVCNAVSMSHGLDRETASKQLRLCVEDGTLLEVLNKRTNGSTYRLTLAQPQCGGSSSSSSSGGGEKPGLDWNKLEGLRHEATGSSLESVVEPLHLLPPREKDEVTASMPPTRYSKRRRMTRASTQRKPEDQWEHVLVSDEGTDRDLAENEPDADPVAGDGEVTPPEGEEGEEGSSELGEASIVSGPSSPPPMEHSGPLGPCSACQKLYQKARKNMRLQLKVKLLDNAPSSLTCDHWVLLKTWRPNRQHHMRGRLLTHLPLIWRRLDEKQVACYEEESEQTACSRPHTFLQRNLRWCVKTSVKSGRRRIRRGRKGSRSVRARGPRLAKQRRSHSDPRPPNDGIHPGDGFNSNPGPGNNREQESSEQQCDTIGPSSVEMEITPKSAKSVPQQVGPKRGGLSIRELLAAALAVKSTIVRETHSS